MLRVVAAIAVVVGHTKSLTNDSAVGYIFFHAAILWGVSIFLMITGHIFLGIKKRCNPSFDKKECL